MSSPGTNAAGRGGGGAWWAVFYTCIAIAALIWSIPHDVLLRSVDHPDAAIITVALMWLEIGVLILALSRRFLRKERSLVLPITLACVALVINLVLTTQVWPAFLFL